MGSFNITCFASQQTIAPDDACIVVPIIQQEAYPAARATLNGKSFELHGVFSSTSYPTAFWRPIGGFLEAHYADYGRVTLADTSTNRALLLEFLRYVLSCSPVIDQGENPIHDLPFNFGEFLAKSAPQLNSWLSSSPTPPAATSDTQQLFPECEASWDYIWDVAAKSRLFGTNHFGRLRPLSFAVMHKAAYDLLVADTEKDTDWDGQPMHQRSFFSRALKSARTEPSGRLAPGPSQELRAFFALEGFRQALHCVGHFEGGSYPAERHELPCAAEAYFSGKITEDEFFSRVQPLLNARYAMAGLQRLNIKLTPLSYAGQDYANEAGRAYAQFIRKASAAVNKSRRRGD